MYDCGLITSCKLLQNPQWGVFNQKKTNSRDQKLNSNFRGPNVFNVRSERCCFLSRPVAINALTYFSPILILSWSFLLSKNCFTVRYSVLFLSCCTVRMCLLGLHVTWHTHTPAPCWDLRDSLQSVLMKQQSEKEKNGGMCMRWSLPSMSPLLSDTHDKIGVNFHPCCHDNKWRKERPGCYSVLWVFHLNLCLRLLTRIH